MKDELNQLRITNYELRFDSSFRLYPFKVKRCPTCQRAYDDSMKFCQADGTPLVAEETQETSPSGDYDPYKTVLGNSIEVQSSGQPMNEPGDDPMKTMLGTPPVDLPPPSPFEAPTSNQSSNANLNSPSFGDLSSNSAPFGGSAPFNQPLPQNESSNPFGQQSSGQFGEPPRTPTYKEPDPSFGQNFGQQASFGQAANEWTPPPAPQQNWGSQGLGQNTPFGAPPMPPMGAGGENKTLAIVSLVCGILSILCCGLFAGIPAIVTGYMAKNNVERDPNTYGGRGLALAGIIMGAISILFSVLYLIYVVLAAIGGR